MCGYVTAKNKERNARVLALMDIHGSYEIVAAQTGLSLGVVAGISKRETQRRKRIPRRPSDGMVRLEFYVTPKMEERLCEEAMISGHRVEDEIRACIRAHYGLVER